MNYSDSQLSNTHRKEERGMRESNSYQQNKLASLEERSLGKDISAQKVHIRF